MIRLFLSLLALVALASPASAWYKGAAVIPAGGYANACGTEPAGQNWCVGTDGWTVVTPTIGTTGTSCATTGTPTWDGSCITYVSDRGTGTLATCRINAPVGFSFTTDPTDLGGGTRDWTKACALTPTVTAAIRTGSSDFLLLQRGSCFIDSPVATNPCTLAANTTTTYGIGSNTDRTSNFGRAGTSKSKPIVIAAFGPIADDRPKIMTINACFRGSTGVTNIMFMHIECNHVWRDPRSSYFIPINSGVSSGAGQKTISNVQPSPTAPLIRVTVASTADLAAQPIYIAGVTGSVGFAASVNGTWASYTIVSPTEVDLIGSTFSGTYTSGGTLGQRQMTVANPIPAEMGIGTGFQMFNYSNAAQMRRSNNDTGIPIVSIDGSRTVLTLARNIPTAAETVASGDRIQFIADAVGGVGFTNDAVDWFYVEGTKISFGSVQMQRIGLPVRAWGCGIIRNVIQYSYGIQTRSQGIFLGDSYDLASYCEMRENVADGNGWFLSDPDCVPGDVLPAKCNGVASEMVGGTNGLKPNESHGAYNHEWFGRIDYIGNILTNNSGAGTQIRGGGIGYNNFTARNSTNLNSGGIMFDTNFTYNVSAQAQAAYWAITPTSAATTGSLDNNVLTFANAPLWVPLSNMSIACGTSGHSCHTLINATTGVNLGERHLVSTTGSTMTFDGPAFNVASGDTIYFRFSTVQWGIQTNNLGRLNPAGIVDPITRTNVQWNISLDATSASEAGSYGGFGFGMGSSTVRTPTSTRSVFANNWVKNWNLGLEDRSQIQSVDGNAACAGLGLGGTNAIRLGLLGEHYFRVGETIELSGVAGITGTVNGTFTVASLPAADKLCLTGSSYTSGTWTAGTGVVNGGVNYNNNRYSGVNTITDTAQSALSFSSFVPAGTMTVEYCDIQLGGSGYLSDFVSRAKLNRLGDWSPSRTANAMNNCIRGQTSPTIALQ